MRARQYSPVFSTDIASMTSLKPRPASVPGDRDLGDPWTSTQAGAGGPGSTRRLSVRVRAWHAIKGAWLAKRLEGVETELLALSARHAAEGRARISKEEMAIYESCCMERAILRAQIAHCRGPD
jgi:hypothetical protein